MSNTSSADAALTVALSATPATPSPSLKAYDFDFTGTNFEMDASVSEEERRFYLKMFPTVDVVNQRKVHCTVCRMHLGTAVSTENNIKMHPILRVTHCIKCHDFYNSGEFSKGEDGSELYCRWCGQGGEVYCCSTCPFVFCKSCIIKNLSRGVIVDIEQNENWNCFKCTSKILWPLRAQHWALVNYIKTQKNGLQSLQLSETELRKQTHKDNSTCCRLAKAKASSLSDSMESLESNASKRSHASSVQSVKKSPKPQVLPAKRPKSSNDEVVCTPDLLSMLEPDCQISVAPKPVPRSLPATTSITTTPRILTVQQNYTGPSPSTNGSSTSTPRSSLPPPLVLSSSGMRMRFRPSTPSPSAVVRRTVVPNSVRTSGPVFHTINGFRVDLNSAAQQDSYRLPNGRLIQVKRQLPPGSQPATASTRPSVGISSQVVIRQQVPQGTSGQTRMAHSNYGSNIGIYSPQSSQQQHQQSSPQVVRVNNSSQVHSVNITPTSASATPASSNGGTTIMMTPSAVAKVPTLVRHVFPNNPIGTARAQLQEQIFNAMEICTHLTGKVQTLTHSNAYNQARSYLDLKELYIHLSYLMTYAIGRFKQLQDKCLVDMREMGFKNDANSLENGQLAAEKQASDDEDNEIEIVEPKTDTITIDSDNEEDPPAVSNVNIPKGLKITSVVSNAPQAQLDKVDPVTAKMESNMDLAAISSSILASLLEVDINDGSSELKSSQAVSPGGSLQKKQPRKKLTNKPNPALLHLERQRMEETKRNDIKLKMDVRIMLRRAEEEFEVARKWIEEHKNKHSEESQTMNAPEEQEENVAIENSIEMEQGESSTEDLLEKMDTSDGSTNSVVETISKPSGGITSERVEENDGLEDKDKTDDKDELEDVDNLEGKDNVEDKESLEGNELLNKNKDNSKDTETPKEIQISIAKDTDNATENKLELCESMDVTEVTGTSLNKEVIQAAKDAVDAIGKNNKETQLADCDKEDLEPDDESGSKTESCIPATEAAAVPSSEKDPEGVSDATVAKESTETTSCSPETATVDEHPSESSVPTDGLSLGSPSIVVPSADDLKHREDSEDNADSSMPQLEAQSDGNGDAI